MSRAGSESPSPLVPLSLMLKPKPTLTLAVFGL